MEKIKRLVYIIAAQKDEDIAQALAKKIDCESVSADVSCGQSAEERNASVTNCDLSVVVISHNTESDEDGRVESTVNILTSKPMVRYIAQDAGLSDSMEYYLAKTDAISEENGNFRSKICEILDEIAFKRDIIIYSSVEDEDIAERLSSDLLNRGVSNLVTTNYEDYNVLLEKCDAVLFIASDKSSKLIKEARKQAKKHKKAVVSCIGWDRQNVKVIDRVTSRSISLLYRIKPASKTMLVADTGKIKLLKKPLFAILCAFICAQVCAVFLWLLSVNREPLYSLPILAVIAGYLWVFLYARKMCSLKECKHKHNGKKCAVIVSRSGKYKKGRIHRLCDAHFDINDVSNYKNKSYLMPIATGATTVLFGIFIIISGARLSDITFLSIIQAFQTLQEAKFEDPGFEAFVRQEFNIRDTTISRERLMDIEELNISVDTIPEEINSLKDLRYFPSLKFFHVDDMEMMEVRGDIKNFKYTPDIEGIELGSGHFFGDVKVFRRLKNIKWIYKSYVYMEIHGDISVFSKLKELEDIHFPNCAVTGDISSFSGSGISTIVLSATKVYGDISAFSDCKNLVDIIMEWTNLTGDLSAISNLDNLENLEISDTKIKGSISDIAHLRLRGLNVSYTSISGTLKEIALIKPLNGGFRISQCPNITGDISQLSKLSKYIMWVSLDQNPQLTGDISVFSNFLRLQNLSFFECPNLRGDISDLANLNKMQNLRMENNNLTGDILAFKDMENLRELMFSENDIYGDIVSFANLTELDSVIVNNTGVYGDIAVFANMPNLHDLHIENTDIYGDAAVIENLPYLYNFFADGTLLEREGQNIQPPEGWEEAYNMMVDSRTMFGETAKDIGENQGLNLGEAQSAELSEDGQYYRISTGKIGDQIIGLDFSAYGDFRGNNKAVLIKFRTDAPEHVSFSLFGLGEIKLRVETGEPFLEYKYSEEKTGYEYRLNEFYSNYMETDLMLEPGKWYWAIMAVSGDGEYRSLVWEDENEDNFAYCAQRLGPIEGRDDLDWHLTLGMDGECNLDIAQYSIMDFERFVPLGQSEGQDMHEDEMQKQEDELQEQEDENQDEGEVPIISGLGITDGEYFNEQEGFEMKIYSMAWNGAEEDMIHFAFTIYDVPVVVDIHYPDNIFEITVDEQFTYKYRPMDYTIVEGPDDIQQKLEGHFGDKTGMISELILEHIDGHCTDAFGYPPRELIMMMYE